MRYATCHPELKHRAKGLCSKCYHVSWVLTHKAQYNKRRLEHYHRNAKRYIANSNACKQRNIERTREVARRSERKRRALGLIDPIKSRQQKSEWKKRNPESNQTCLARRRATLHKAEINDFTTVQWKLMKTVYNNSCFYCGSDKYKLTQDHIIPISRGGNHNIFNIVPACALCNCRKNNKTLKEYINAVDPTSLSSDLSLVRHGVRTGSGVLLVDSASR